MAGWTAPPVLVQVAALAAVAVIAAQIVTFALIVLAPEPRPAATGRFITPSAPGSPCSQRRSSPELEAVADGR